MKKGFTLVELLAVIVILAIIALIAVPIIMNVVESSRKSSATSSAYGYIKGVNITYANELLLGNNFELEGTLLVDESGNIDGHKVDVEGTAIKGGYLVYEDNKIKEGCLEINDYKVSIENDEVKTSEKGICDKKYKAYKNGYAVYFNPVTNKSCTEEEANSNLNENKIPTGIKEGCMKWYVFNDTNDSSKVNLLLDHNTTPLVMWNSSGNSADGMKEVQEALESDTETWNETVKKTARLITADEIAKITKNTTFDSKKVGTEGFYYLDTNDFNKRIAYHKGESNYTWLFDYTYGCTDYGCNLEDNTKYVCKDCEILGGKNNIFGYWTSSTVFGYDNLAWRIGRISALGTYVINLSYDYGLRPVIEIDKSLLS